MHARWTPTSAVRRYGSRTLKVQRPASDRHRDWRLRPVACNFSWKLMKIGINAGTEQDACPAGDGGAMSSDDLLLAISYSGERRRSIWRRWLRVGCKIPAIKWAQPGERPRNSRRPRLPVYYRRRTGDARGISTSANDAHRSAVYGLVQDLDGRRGAFAIACGAGRKSWSEQPCRNARPVVLFLRLSMRQ